MIDVSLCVGNEVCKPTLFLIPSSRGSIHCLELLFLHHNASKKSVNAKATKTPPTRSYSHDLSNSL